MKHFCLILMKTVFDALGRVTLVFAWLTLSDDKGNFPPDVALIIYYSFVLILLFFNIIFSKSKFSFSSSYFLGEYEMC